MREGMLVKIEDIGPLATVIQVRMNEVEIELEGERFWIDKSLVEVVKW